ncbi:MAG TPA: polyprenyl diphosphate synthase [Thermoanaerobaculia bacterium]|nr:polyprenyl diphosphate synthase [Thermoanaerobaculia bacterium]HQR68258.1 polyprenyl diphosphate synthase [Thermoanaerobaculia bacterium]
MSAAALPSAAPAPGLHVAIIMDGNGRWAEARGLPRTEGHRRGASTVREIVEAAPRLGIGILTLYAFSADNWKRPAGEVATLMRLFGDYLRREALRCVRDSVRLTVIGRRDRLAPPLRGRIEAAEQRTLPGSRLHLRLAVDYSARDAIWSAVERAVTARTCSREEFSRLLRSGRGEPASVPDVDLVVRTGGEMRLSDFLLWESAYAELWFTSVRWPDFSPADLAAAVAAYRTRTRRFGGLAEAEELSAGPPRCGAILAPVGTLTAPGRGGTGRRSSTCPGASRSSGPPC